MSREFSYNDWVKNRKRTTIVFYLQALALGMEFSLTFTNLYLYLVKIIQTENDDLYYGFISGAYITSQIIFSLVLGRLFDMYRNLRTMFWINNCLLISGNILYMVSLSPLYLLFGRIISGVGGSLRAIMTSELARSYPDQELLPKFSIMGMCFASGYVLGPGLNFAFVNADFWIGKIHITYANGCGLVLIALFSIIQIMAIFMVKDLSKIYDLKNEGLFEINESTPLKSSHTRQKKPTTTSLTVFKAMMCHPDTAILLFFSFLFMISYSTFDMYEPMVFVKFFDWGILELNMSNSGYGVVAFVMYIFILSRPPSYKTMINWFATLGVSCLAVMDLIFVVFKLFHVNLGLNISLVVLYTLLFSIVMLLEDIFLITAMSKLVSSDVQALVEGIRLAFSRVGAVVGLIFAAPTFRYMHYVCGGYFLLTLLAFGLLLWRRRYLQDPDIVIDFCDNRSVKSNDIAIYDDDI